MKALIDGIEYVPKAEVPELTDKKLQGCLEVLTEMRYFNEPHKMIGLAWNAIAELDTEITFNKIPEKICYDE